MDNFHALASLHNPDVITIVESWLSPDIVDSDCVSIPNYQIIRFDRDRHGRGILIYVSDKYTVKLLNKGPFALEFMSISVHCTHFKACLCFVYHPLSSSS